MIITGIITTFIIVIEGLKIPITELSKSNMLIKSLPTKDLLIKNSQMLSLQQGDIMLPYITKTNQVACNNNLSVCQKCTHWTTTHY